MRFGRVIAISLALALSACSSAPQPSGDAILVDERALPKALATLPRTPTLDAAAERATREAAMPTANVTPSATATPTPVRGVFMGNLFRTAEAPIISGALQTPLIVTQPALATTRQAASPIIGLNPPIAGANPPPLAINRQASAQS